MDEPPTPEVTNRLHLLRETIAVAEKKQQRATLIELLTAYVALDPVKTQYRYLLATNLLLTGHLRQALEVFRALDVARFPQGFRFARDFAIGQIHDILGEFAEAERHYRDALTHRSHLAEPYVYLAKLLMKQSRFDEAIDILRRATAIEGDQTEVEKLLAKVSVSQRRYHDARDHFRAALLGRPHDGKLASRLADTEEAIRISEWLAALPPIQRHPDSD